MIGAYTVDGDLWLATMVAAMLLDGGGGWVCICSTCEAGRSQKPNTADVTMDEKGCRSMVAHRPWVFLVVPVRSGLFLYL